MSEQRGLSELRIVVAGLVVFMILLLILALTDRAEAQERVVVVNPGGYAQLPHEQTVVVVPPVPYRLPVTKRIEVGVTDRTFPDLTPKPPARAVPSTRTRSTSGYLWRYGSAELREAQEVIEEWREEERQREARKVWHKQMANPYEYDLLLTEEERETLTAKWKEDHGQ